MKVHFSIKLLLPVIAVALLFACTPGSNTSSSSVNNSSSSSEETSLNSSSSNKDSSSDLTSSSSSSSHTGILSNEGVPDSGIDFGPLS